MDVQTIINQAGRYSAPEYFTTVTHSGPGTAAVTQVPQPISLTRPMAWFHGVYRGRVVIGTAAMGVVAAEAPQTILNRLRINGVYKRSSIAPIDISGSTLFAMGRLWSPRGNTLIINGVRQGELTIPNAQVTATFGNVGTYDIEVYYTLPMFPVVSPGNRAMSASPFYWQSQDWGNSLQVTVDLGNQTSFGTLAGTTTVVFSAIGGATGSPTFDMYTTYCQLGPAWNSFQTQLVVRSEQASQTTITALANNTNVANLAKQITSSVLVKTGIGLSTSYGVPYTSLSDVMLNRTQVVVDNRPVKNNQDNRMMKELTGMEYQSVMPGGYLVFPFIDSMNPRTAFRADEAAGVIGSGSQFAIVTDVITANAGNLMSYVQEQIWANPGDPYWTNGGVR